MKTASTQLTNSLLQNNTVTALPQLIAQWNLNRYYPVVCDNTPSEDSDGFDLEMFPIESIIKPNRPTKGINKARINEGKVSYGYGNPKPARFYIGDYDDIYKYWTSPYPSDPATGVIANVAPYVIYATKADDGTLTYTNVSSNKVVVKFENSWATPANFTIDLRLAGVWTTVFTQADLVSTAWEALGELSIYYNGTNWRQNNVTSNSVLRTDLTGVRVTVTSLKGGVQEDGTTTSYTNASSNTLIPTTGNDSHLSIIEISARRVADLSADLISVDDSFDMGDSSNLYPIGTLTTNTGNISLWNGENQFSNDDVRSPYKGILEPNVRLSLNYVYDFAGVKETVKEFELYSGTWSGQKSATVEVELDDHSKFFQEIIPRAAMWENLTVPQILFRLCDSIGFNNYLIDPHSAVTNFVIPVFWVDGEKNMWEILDDIGKASQSAIYFDGVGVLRIKTREAAFDDTKSPAYSLRSTQSGTTLANIVSAEQTTAYEANTINVAFQKTRWSDYNNGQPVMQKVWEPEDTMALRSTPLRASMTTASDYITIGPDAVKYWLYTGLVNIDGEIMRYDGLEFVYYTYVGTAGTRNVVVVTSAEEKTKFNNLTPVAYQFRNSLTGRLRIAKKGTALQRGQWNSAVAAHSVDANGYFVRRIVNGTRTAPVNGLSFLPSVSRIQLLSNLGYKAETDLLIATTGSTIDTGFWFYGTKFRFLNRDGMVHQRAGLTFHNDGSTQENGYFVELTPTSRMTASVRAVRNELMLYTRINGKLKALGKGAAVDVIAHRDNELDISVRSINGNHYIKVWVNGRLCISITVTGTDRQATNGRFGLFTFGRSCATFEYLYALRREEAVDPPDDFSFLDKKTGAYVGDLWNREWVYRWATKIRTVKRKSTKISYRLNDKYFDEFGPWVHEIREFNVSFDPNPVLHSRPFLTNDWCAAVLEYSGTPFGAKFIVANVARTNAIINGEDSLTFAGSGSTVNQVFNIFGRPLVIDEAETKTFKDDAQIQRRGAIEAEITSTWIQSEEMANALGKWILKNMSYGNDELDVEIFGNPLIEVTDVVDVYYPDKNLNGQKYFVTGVNNSFDQGLSTTLTLRRANPSSV